MNFTWLASAYDPGDAAIGAFGAGMAVAGPVAAYLLVLWILHELQHPDVPNRPGGPVAAVLVLLTPLTGHAILLTGGILAGLLSWKLVGRHRAAVGRNDS